MGGAADEEVPAGLLLNALDPLVERIVLGQTSPEEHDAVKSSDVKPADVVRRGRKSRWGRRGAEPEAELFDDGDAGSPRDTAE